MLVMRWVWTYRVAGYGKRRASLLKKASSREWWFKPAALRFDAARLASIVRHGSAI